MLIYKAAITLCEAVTRKKGKHTQFYNKKADFTPLHRMEGSPADAFLFQELCTQ